MLLSTYTCTSSTRVGVINKHNTSVYIICIQLKKIIVLARVCIILEYDYSMYTCTAWWTRRLADYHISETQVAS